MLTRDLAGCLLAASEVAAYASEVAGQAASPLLRPHFYHFDDEGTMAEGDSPAIARRRVRMVLREARENAGFTQLDVAEEMEWSLSKVIRIENGDVSIAPNDLKPLLGYLGVKDRAVVADLLADAKIARTRQRQVWYQTPKFREHLTEPLRKLIEYEAEAHSIHGYSVFHVPGQLQVPEYSTALMDTWSEELTPEQIHFRLEARKRRRAAILDRVGSLKFYALLDESVFMRAVGGPATLRSQLEELVRLSEIGLLAIRVIRFSAELPMSYNAGFDILFLGADGDLSNAAMYRETGTSDEIVEDAAIGKTASLPQTPGTVARHYGRFLKLWDAAEGEDDTIAFIQKRIRELVG
jgi:transcriptional regulator with XRE-family HTH domain